MQKHHTPCKLYFRFYSSLLFLIIPNLWLISCSSGKKIVYFENLPRDTMLHNLVTRDFELKIRKGDVISISVSSLSVESSAIFNAPQVSMGEPAVSGVPGFLVDIKGDIGYPKLGLLHVEGLTRNELKNLLAKELSPYLKEAVITVNFANQKVTVMGEVTNPQVLSLTAENLTLLQALALCGGINKTARRDNVLVIRENGTDKEFKRVNLNNSSVFYSPFYYLRPDDIVYVEPDISRKESGSTQQIITFISTGLSLLFLILSRIK